MGKAFSQMGNPQFIQCFSGTLSGFLIRHAGVAGAKGNVFDNARAEKLVVAFLKEKTNARPLDTKFSLSFASLSEQDNLPCLRILKASNST